MATLIGQSCRLIVAFQSATRKLKSRETERGGAAQERPTRALCRPQQCTVSPLSRMVEHPDSRTGEEPI